MADRAVGRLGRDGVGGSGGFGDRRRDTPAEHGRHGVPLERVVWPMGQGGGAGRGLSCHPARNRLIFVEWNLGLAASRGLPAVPPALFNQRKRLVVLIENRDGGTF